MISRKCEMVGIDIWPSLALSIAGKGAVVELDWRLV